MQFTPHDINDLFPLKSNHILVFSSNTEGRHGKGLALLAKQKAGAKYGQARGMQGQSYAIVTKDLSKGVRSVPLSSIKNELITLYEVAIKNPDLIFFVGKIGCDLAGYTVNEMANIFNSLESTRPQNIILPIEFSL
jgi:hypothetical protein